MGVNINVSSLSLLVFFSHFILLISLSFAPACYFLNRSLLPHVALIAVSKRWPTSEMDVICQDTCMRVGN